MGLTSHDLKFFAPFARHAFPWSLPVAYLETTRQRLNGLE